MPVVTWRGTARAPENRIHLSFVQPDGMVLRLRLGAKAVRDVAETLLEYA